MRNSKSIETEAKMNESHFLQNNPVAINMVIPVSLPLVIFETPFLIWCKAALSYFFLRLLHLQILP